jgi:hypothetical protein
MASYGKVVLVKRKKGAGDMSVGSEFPYTYSTMPPEIAEMRVWKRFKSEHPEEDWLAWGVKRPGRKKRK